jgi:alanyl-tRNA synthetase
VLETLLTVSQSLSGIDVVAASPQVAAPDELLALADAVRERLPNGVVVLASEVEGRAALVVSATDAAVGRGVHANDVLKVMLPAVAGKGGGRPTLARGSGTQVAGIEAAVEAAVARVRELLQS